MSEPARISRRMALGRLAAGAGLVVARPGRLSARQSSACPSLSGQRISWLVGWSPGGGYDMYSRLIEPALQNALRAEVVVENLPGAAGVVAARRLSTAKPDGLTLGILNGTGLVTLPHAGSAYAPSLDRDFTLLARVVDHRQTLAVGAHLGVTSIDQLIALGRRRPIVLGDTGAATVNVLLGALLGELFGIDVRLVLGFPGSVQIVTSVLRGELDGLVAGEDSLAGADGLVPIARFQSKDGPGSDQRALPRLLGDDSLLDRSPELFPDLSKARDDVVAVEALIAVGRVIAAPPALPAPLRDCLESAMLACLSDPALVRRASQARRSLAPASAAAVLRDVAIARRAVPRFDALLSQALGRERRS